VTDPGRVRAANEDAFVAAPEFGLWAVADGMGGHVNGQWASRTVAQSLGNIAFADDFDADSLRVADAIHAANATIFAEASAAGKQMGSTAAALYMHDRRFAVLWAGDSRVYLLRDGALHRLTRDHTQVQEMVDRGYLTEEDAKNHPMSHVISRAVGVQAQLEVDAVADEIKSGDVFLLCSDGLYGVVPDHEIAAQLSANSPQAACQRLVEVCLERGAPDNVTIIAIACDPITLLTLLPGQVQ
jgi:serine/threonine protein phosphatase Stp1